MSSYVENKEFLDELIKRRAIVDQCKLAEKAIPPISNTLGKMLLTIGNGLTYKKNFIAYTFKDDMVCDGIIDCVKAVDKYDLERINPHAYFTKIFEHAFVRRITIEEIERNKKYDLIKDLDIDSFETQLHDVDESFKSSFLEYLRDNSSLRKERKIIPRKAYVSSKHESSFEDFFGGEE